MKKLFVKLARFFVILIPSYLLCLLLFTSGPLNNWVPNVRNFTGGYGHSLMRFREIENNRNYDIVFLGSSRVYRGFDPRVFEHYGLSIFDLGSPAQISMNTYYLVKKYIDFVQASIFVFEISSLADSTGDESAIDLISNLPFSSDMFEMGLETLKGKQIRTLNSILLAYLRRIFIPLSKARQRSDPENIYVSRGYVETVRVRNVIERLGMIRPQQKRIELNYFRKIIELFRERKKTLILVFAPLTRHLKKNTPNHGEFVAVVRLIARQSGLSFIDFNEKQISQALGLNDEKDFYDGSHLNQQGVEKFNKFLIERYLLNVSRK